MDLSENDALRRPLINRRILICGKGGSGKSTLTALLGNAFEKKGYPVIMLDGDASNPGGLSRLVMGSEHGPKPLINYFGGRQRVTCPVDDPAPLRMPNTDDAVQDVRVDLEMLPPEYYIRAGNKILIQSGKIRHLLEGCDGPMSKITRDLRFSNEHIMLIDVEAGIEHFGRGVEAHVDMVLVVVDPAFESLEVAGRVSDLCDDIGICHVWAVLNGVKSSPIKELMEKKVWERELPILGVLFYSEYLEQVGLEGTMVDIGHMPDSIIHMVEKLEKSVVVTAGT